MDSASSSLTFVTRDGPVPAVDGEDDSALLVAAGLAKEAVMLFQNGKFSECLRVLSQLAQKKEVDPKVNYIFQSYGFR